MPNKTVAPNGIYQIEGTFTEENNLPYNPAVDYSIVGNTDTRTSISNTGILKLGGSEAGPTITVTGEWRNDDGTTDNATLSLDVDPQGEPYWPNPPVTATVWITQQGGTITDSVKATVAAFVHCTLSDGSTPTVTGTVAGSDNTTWVDQATDDKVGKFVPDALAVGSDLTVTVTPAGFEPQVFTLTVVEP